MVDFDKIVQSDVHKFTQLVDSFNSKSKYDKVWYDYSMLDGLASFMGIEVPKSFKYNYNYKKINRFSSRIQLSENLTYLSEACRNAIEAYKYADFYNFERPDSGVFTLKERDEIIEEFFKTYLPDGLEFYKKVKKDDSLFTCPLEGASGLAFMMPAIDRYYLIFDQKEQLTIRMIETIIHETIHCYCADFLNKFRVGSACNLNSSYFVESYTMLIELLFYDYIKEEHIVREPDLHRNGTDFTLLCFFKNIVYAKEMSNRGYILRLMDDYFDIVSPNGDDLTEEELRYDKDKDVVSFNYPTTNYFIEQAPQYAASTLDAYQLYKVIKSGKAPEEVIKKSLLRFQFPVNVQDIITSEYDFEFLEDEIKEHGKLLKKKYGLENYTVR